MYDDKYGFYYKLDLMGHRVKCPREDAESEETQKINETIKWMWDMKDDKERMDIL